MSMQLVFFPLDGSQYESTCKLHLHGETALCPYAGSALMSAFLTFQKARSYRVSAISFAASVLRMGILSRVYNTLDRA